MTDAQSHAKTTPLLNMDSARRSPSGESTPSSPGEATSAPSHPELEISPSRTDAMQPSASRDHIPFSIASPLEENDDADAARMLQTVREALEADMSADARGNGKEDPNGGKSGLRFPLDTPDFTFNTSAEPDVTAATTGASKGHFTIPPTARAPVKSRNVYVACLPLDFSEDKLRDMLTPFGNVLSCRTFTNGDKVSETGRAYGFVLFERPEEAVAAVERLNGAQVPGGRLQVQLSRACVIRKPRERPEGQILERRSSLIQPDSAKGLNSLESPFMASGSPMSPAVTVGSPSASVTHTPLLSSSVSPAATGAAGPILQHPMYMHHHHHMALPAGYPMYPQTPLLHHPHMQPTVIVFQQSPHMHAPPMPYYGAPGNVQYVLPPQHPHQHHHLPQQHPHVQVGTPLSYGAMPPAYGSR